VYLPPHVVLESTREAKGSAGLKAAAFRPEEELPKPLPAGAHRVISEMTSAQMRKMMEGVVLFGTGRPAQLDGYSAGGKTGTAQKIDPKTRTYSKTKYVASFVGFAPVSDPAVTIAVVMDSPMKGSHFGTAASAPVFHDLAQQILEYLGVPHDQDLQPEKVAQNAKPVAESAPEEHTEDLESLFAEVNHLPADDPLSNTASNNGSLEAPPLPDAAIGDRRSANSKTEPGAWSTQLGKPGEGGQGEFRGKPGSVAIADERVAVPLFAGKSLREVVVAASGAGLGLQVVGSGIAREQAPAAGTMVPAGTEIVVRFGP
jgi:cell division protein FtsI (penicillin-binding protein 3)